MNKTIQFDESVHGSYESFSRTNRVISVTPTEWRTQPAINDPGGPHSPAGLYSSPEKQVISKAHVTVDEPMLIPGQRLSVHLLSGGGYFLPSLPSQQDYD
jgi:hypothetical protein